MNDRELLELAAKAAGLDVEFPDADTADWLVCNDFANASDQWLICNSLDEEGDVIGWWNPLKNDGDAFRLATKLRISVHQAEKLVQAVNHPSIYADEDVSNGRDQATRRAIVRAAAEIGRAQPPAMMGRDNSSNG